MAERVFGLMLTDTRYDKDGAGSPELRGRPIAFYGCGAVARAVGRIARAFLA